MKTFNLIKWLWTDSHEKQSPQRFVRYAAILIMLLTLGVGQMWAAYYCPGTLTAWSQTSSEQMTQVGSTNTYYKVVSSKAKGDYQFRVTAGSWDKDHGWSQAIAGSSDFTLTSAGSDNNINIKLTATSTLTVWFNSTDNKIWVTSGNYATQTVYVIGSNSWTDSNVKAHAFTGAAAYYAWASDQTMTKTSTISRAGITYKVYSYTFPKGYKGIIFRYGSSQTDDLTWNASTTYYSVETSGWYATTADALAKYLVGQNWTDASWDHTAAANKMTDNGDGSYSKNISISDATKEIALKISAKGTWTPSWDKDDKGTGHNLSQALGGSDNLTFKVTHAGTTKVTLTSDGKINVDAPYQVSYAAGTGATGTVSASSVTTYGSTCTLSSSTFSKTGYTQDGWATSDGGDKAYNLGATYTGGYTDVTLYPHWTETMSTVSFVASPTGKGTFKVGGSTVTSTTAGVTTTRSVTAVPISGYHFVSWSITGGASISSTTTNPTTVTGGGAGTAATLTATFAADDVYSLTVAAGTGISAVTGSTNDIKAAQNIAITATVATGYTWNTWTKTGAGSLSTFTAGTKNQTVTVGTAGDITLTASATENMSTLTTSNHYDAGDPSYSAPSKSVSSIGISTTADLTAAAPGTGYTFAGWTLSSNIVVTSGNAATDRSITIRTNGNGAAATAQANYTEDLSSPYTIKGGTNITGNNWSTAYNMTKKSGHSTESVVYYTFNISSTNSGISGSADDWSFKVIKDGSTWYGLYASGSYWWRRSTSANQPLTGEQNIQICADVAGTYEIKVDYSTATPKVTVTFPTKYTVTYSVAPSGAADAITTSPNVSSGGEVASGTSITFTHASANSGYTWYRWENGSGSSLGTGSTYNTSISANTTVVAKYTENNYTVTVQAGAGGSVSSGSVTGHVSTKVTLPTATPNTGYYFTGWTVTTGSATLTSASSATAAQVNGLTAAATVTANFSPIWYLKGDFNSWGEGNPITLASATSGSVDLTTTSAKLSNSKFKIWNKQTDTYYQKASQSITRAANTASGGWTSGGTSNDMKFNSDVIGDYTFAVTFSSNIPSALTVTYPTAYTVTYGVGTLNGSSSAISVSPSFTSGDYVLPETDVTFSKGSTKAGYTWKGWYSNVGGTGGAWSTTDANLSLTATRASSISVYACYTLNTYTITYHLDGGTNYASNPANFNVTTSTITLGAPTKTGYTFSGWYKDEDFKTSGNTITTGTYTNQEFWAKWTAKNYTITLHEQGATTSGTPGDGGTISVTYDATTNLSKITAVPERTGYTFGGYYDTEECDGTWIIKTDTYFNWDGTYLNSTTGKWQYDGNLNLYAKWTANQYTVTLDVDEANKGTIAGATTSQNIYYDDATVTVPNRPTAANGYALDGYYTEQLGAGTKVINGDGTWIASVEGYTDASKHWIHAGDVTLYAYYKKAEITAITLDATTVESKGTVSFAVTISPTPTGTTKTCFTVLHSNDNPLAEQPTITYNGGTGKYSFTAPEASGTYKVEAVLRTGSSCAGGTELDTEVASFQVAGTHTVTVRYKCGGEDIKAATALDGIRPLNWSDAITAPNIIGYSFTGWSTGDGVSLTDDNGTTTKTSTTEADIKIKAIYDGYLTANYSKKRVIYFNNTLGWENVYVYFYKNGTYWDATYGTGCNTGYQYTDYPFSESLYGQMLPVEEGSKIYYFDAEAAGVNASYQTVVFTELDQHTYNWFSKTGNVKNKVIKRDDYYSSKLPMYVPLAVQTPVSKNDNTADYYWQGYWMNYPENTGYTLKIYNQKATDGAVELKSIPFEFTADKTMPMELDVDLEAGKTYGFKIYRNDGLNTGAGSYYGNTGTMTENAEGWDMKTTASSNTGLQTTAAGSYKFVLNFYEISSDYQYRVSVTYPVAVGDYRIVYTDGATWSGSAHTASWNHPSGVIAKNSSATETKKDTVSFFWSYGSSPAIGYQTCSSLSAGSASWSAKTAINVSGYSSVLTKTGVYNFIFEQPAGGASISLVKVEPYTGNYYIRTDVANSKWDNYRTDPDHVMTYSDYSIDHGGYSHYYCHWVQTDERKNVKFTIANDYSPCISDTLIRETASGDWTNITYYIESNGDVKRPANVRFMWNQSTNVISRAYIDGAQEKLTYFLEIRSSDDKIRDPDDHTILNQISFNDIENWVYEQNIQAQPGAQIKLLSNWGTENTITQYFKGSSSATEQLIGGSGSAWYDIRVIYDFKTNRLIASYIPVDENITTEKAIEADIMFIREHQGDIAQLTFGENGKITKIETAYGVMRLNKWTLNNLSKTYPHNPLSSPASIYERSLFYISFPFRVKLSDVIGFGTYGVHWAVQRYDGAARAQKGHFQENGSFWKWMNRNTEYLEPNQGYLLAIDLDLLGRYSDIWGPTDGGGVERRSERLEIYFPSYGTMPDITNASVTCSIPEHPCTINWYEEGKVPGPDTGDPRTSYNRTIFDSHWNVMSVPTYVNTNAIAFANTSWVTTFGGPNFLYTWNANDNTIAATSATGFEYHAMHSYMVQYGGNVTWTARSGSPAGIVASKTYAEQPSKVEFCLELQQDSAMIDRTFVALSNDEETSAGFRFGEDLTKEFNANKANIYTFIADEATAAGNTLPMSDQTTIVPVGVDIKTNGDYTFTIPDGTSGIGVTLIDTETGIRTSLSALSYTVNLTAGTHDGRFLLEIAPIQQTPTDIDLINGENGENGVRKMLIDQQMYIIRDGKIYDARGARVQ